MRQYFILISVIQCITSLNTLSGQTTYWVSNDPSDAELVQFNNLQTAINSVDTGDVIIVYPSELSYGAITVNKSIIIEGMGYQFNAILQPSLDIQTMNYQTIIASIHISGTSEVNIKGVYCTNLDIQGSNNITITNSQIHYGTLQNNENILIHGCYIGSGFLDDFTLRFLNTNNILLSNCIFSHYSPSSSQHNLLINPDCGNAIVQNCIFNDDVHINNTMFINNIHYQGGLGHSNCIVTNNISTGFYNNNPPGNLYGVPSSTIFVGLPTQGVYSFDSRYQLLPNSPARDYGVNGVDCGVFDGDFPYRLSGITNRPIVAELVVPTSTYNEQMEITVRVKIID